MRRRSLIIALSAIVCLAAPAAFLLSPGKARHAAAEAAGNANAAGTRDAADKKRSTEVKLAAVTGSFNVEGMEKTAETDSLVLLVNKQTAEIAVGDKRSGHIWYSSPPDRDADAKASPFEKEGLASQIGLSFSDNAGTLKTMLSYNDSVKSKQFEVKNIKDGVQIVYTLGDMSKGITALPKAISVERMEQFMGKIDKEQSGYTLRKYQLNESKKVYERFDESLTSELSLKKVVESFQNAGYTDADLAKDNADNRVTEDGGNGKPSFTIPLEIKLDGDNLIVSLSADQLKEPKNSTIMSISLFPYFGAAGTKDSGYMLVPDGSGSLIYLNNGKFKEDIYSQPLYGSDEAIRQRFKEQNSQGARLPVFGLKSGDSAMYGIVEKGAALASINAQVSGKTNSYNNVYASFTMRNKDELPMGNGSSFVYVPVLQSERAHGDLSVRYGFVYGEDASYGGMARAYQSYLQLKPAEASENLPFFLDLIGSIPKRKSFLGVPYEAMEPLTTFSQAQQIVQQLKDNGIGDMKVRYLGWFNGGVNHKVPTSISVDGKLGGKSGLQKLSTYLKANGIDFYPDVSFTRVFHDTWSFSPSRDASRYITRSVVEKHPYDLSFLRMNSELGHYYLLSPSKLPSYVDDYLSSYKKYGFGGVSLRYVGSELNPDYRVSKIYDKQQAADIITEQLKKISAQAPDVLISGGNAYTLPFAKNLVDVPLTDSRFNVTDESVPFYQMVVHGFIPYAGKSFNLADDQDIQHNILKAVEYGANVRFTWIYNDPAAVKDTELNDQYSVSYSTWFQAAKAAYEKVNSTLKDVQSQRMISHAQIEDGVYTTTYENGKTIIVNYTEKTVFVNGTAVESKNFAVEGR